MFKLIDARAGKDRMRMGVNKTGQDDSSTGIYYFAVPRDQSLDRFTLSDALNPTLANK